MPLENKIITIDTDTLWDIVDKYIDQAIYHPDTDDLTYNCVEEIQETAEKQRKNTQCK